MREFGEDLGIPGFRHTTVRTTDYSSRAVFVLLLVLYCCTCRLQSTTWFVNVSTFLRNHAQQSNSSEFVQKELYLQLLSPTKKKSGNNKKVSNPIWHLPFYPNNAVPCLFSKLQCCLLLNFSLSLKKKKK